MRIFTLINELGTAFPSKLHVHPADRSACMSLQSDQSTQWVLWVAKASERLQADSQD